MGIPIILQSLVLVSKMAQFKSYAAGLLEELNITNVCDCKRVTKQHEDDCAFTSIIKDQSARARSRGIKCVPLLQQHFINNVYPACMLLLNPEKSEPLPKSILPVKISWLIFFCSFRGGNEKFVDIRAGSLSRLAASLLDFALAATLLVLQSEPATINY